MFSTATATIDFTALAHNFQVIKNKAPESKVLAVLKANAYGHGLERIAKALPKADAFGVARIDEALSLVASGVKTPIVLLEGFFHASDIDLISKNNLQTVIHTKEQLHALITADIKTPIKVWLKIDTGMHRLGIEPQQFNDFYQRLLQSSNVQTGIVLMSHFSCADDINNPVSIEQIALFKEVITNINAEMSIANSAGICNWPSSHMQWIRPGLMLYGVSPTDYLSREALDLKPVMTLQSSIIAKRRIKAGEPVGYGAAWVAKEETTIGVIAIGYGDGYPRHAVNGTPVLINNRIVPLVGRVSMDMITVDLGANSSDNIGDIATLWGKGLAVEEIACSATTIPYELLCNISLRVKVRILSDD